MTAFPKLQAQLKVQPKTWLNHVVACFIGSNLLEALRKLKQRMVGLDNFTTSHRRNADEIQGLLPPKQWTDFQFIEGDIRNLEDCHQACLGVGYVLQQAGLSGVKAPLSINSSVITKATTRPRYAPSHHICQDLALAMPWYIRLK
jgi:UDP-N-acetylglucosamine 4-epimerase